MMWGYEGMGIGAGGMGIGMLVFWALIIAVIVVLVRGLAARPATGDVGMRGSTPLDILRARYARGEIDKSEFEEMRRKISGD